MDLFLRNKSKVENCQLGLVRNIKEPAVSMKQLAKNQQLEKPFFENFKKIEVLYQIPILDFFFTPAG
jgi:hypothetical protein